MEPPKASNHGKTSVDSLPNLNQKGDALSDKEGSVSKPERLNPYRGSSLCAVYVSS